MSSKEEKKKQYDARKKAAVEAGIKDKKLISDVASEKISLAEALKSLAPLAGDSNEQGQGSSQAQSSDQPEGAGPAGAQPGATQPSPSSEEPGKDKQPGASAKEPSKGKEKVFEVLGNAHCNGREFHKGQVVHKDDKDFKSLLEAKLIKEQGV